MKSHAAVDKLGVVHVLDVANAEYPQCGSIFTPGEPCPGSNIEIADPREWPEPNLDTRNSVCDTCSQRVVVYKNKVLEHFWPGALTLDDLGPVTLQHAHTPPVTVFDVERRPAGGGLCPFCPWDETLQRLDSQLLDMMTEAVEAGYDESAGCGDWLAWARATIVHAETNGFVIVPTPRLAGWLSAAPRFVFHPHTHGDRCMYGQTCTPLYSVTL